MNVAYLGPLKDYSGYGEANRHAIAALDAAGCMVMAQMVSYAPELADFGKMGEMVDRLVKNVDDYKIKIIHTTPDQYPKFIEEGKYNIGHFFWETDKVPPAFAAGLKLVDEIWTGSNANVQAIKKAGITVPVYVYPQATQIKREWPRRYEIEGFDGYLFYSIFEWTERKNPAALLNAYWRAFQGDQNVGLLIKTYHSNFNYDKKKMIRSRIDQLKRQSGLKKFPPLFVYLDLMDRHQVERIHVTGDCFVSATRGEGWGIPQVEALLAGNPVISTNYGGVHEYLENGKDAILLDHEMVRVRGMERSEGWYSIDQNWADVKIDDIVEAMTNIYTNKETSEAMAKHGQKTAIDKFNFETVGQQMRARLEEIERGL